MDARQVAAALRQFAVEAAAAGSPLYERLSNAAAGDARLTGWLAETVRPGQPAANMLFATTQWLLEEQRDDPLARDFADPVRARNLGAELEVHFFDFLHARQVAVRELLSRRFVQTNEVRRCCAVGQACAFAAQSAGGRPLAVVEIGTSAGLNLLFDRYRYRYTRNSGADFEVGPADATVVLETEWRGPHAPLALPNVVTRLGIDMNVLHVDREPDRRWLRALVWPEHADRRRLLDAAIEQMQRTPVRLLEGAAAEQLPGALAQLPEDALALVWHTHVMHQVPEAERALLHQQLQDFARRRTCCASPTTC